MIKVLEKKINLYCKELSISIKHLSILLSFSGGIDSTVLATLLVELRNKYDFKLYLIHFNHNIHNKSKQMDRFCQSFALKNNVAYYNKNISFDSKANFEASARKKRYSELDNLSNKLGISIIFTAHHLDDQIETLYMKELDQSDWISRIGIRDRLGKIRRPLIDIQKELLRKTANDRKMTWVEDPTNTDITIRRNHVRKFLLPNVLKNFPETIIELLDNANKYKTRMAMIISNINRNKTTFIKYESNEYISIFINKIKDFEIEYLKIFIYWCNSKYFKIKIPQMTRSFWIEFSNYLKLSRTGSKFTIGSLVIIKNRDELLLTPLHSNLFCKPDKIRLRKNNKWFNSYFYINNNHNNLNLTNKNQFLIPLEIFNNGLYMRQWKKGDRILSASSKKHILISDLFINNKLSIIKKLTHPIVVDKTDRILWVPGMAHADIKEVENRQTIKVIKWENA